MVTQLKFMEIQSYDPRNSHDLTLMIRYQDPSEPLSSSHAAICWSTSSVGVVIFAGWFLFDHHKTECHMSRCSIIFPIHTWYKGHFRQENFRRPLVLRVTKGRPSVQVSFWRLRSSVLPWCSLPWRFVEHVGLHYRNIKISSCENIWTSERTGDTMTQMKLFPSGFDGGIVLWIYWSYECVYLSFAFRRIRMK